MTAAPRIARACVIAIALAFGAIALTIAPPVHAQTGVCDRTAQVRDAIVGQVGARDCSEVTADALRQIYSLVLTERNITALRAGDFAGLTGLRELWLYGNRLATLPAGVFGGLAALERISLRNNQLATLPTDVFDGLVGLETLGLHGNQLATLPTDVFEGLTALEELSLSGNQLATLPPGVFEGLTALEYLDLYGNQLATLPLGVLEGLTALDSLHLYDNQLATLPVGVFEGLTALDALHLYDNQLATLPAGVFEGLTALEWLGLWGNQLATLPADVFEGLAALAMLDLGYNDQLATLPADVFEGLTALVVLGLSGNQLATLPADVFEGLTALEDLYLNDNQLTTLPPGVFDGLTALEQLELSRNPLKTLPPGVFEGLVALEQLELVSNEFATLPPGVFDGLTALEQLKLSGPLTTLPPGVFEGLAALEQLELSGNLFATLPPGVFEGLAALVVLDLGYNNQLATLPVGVFEGLTALRRLELHDNPLTTLPAGMFEGLDALVVLDLSGNQFATLPPGVFEGLTMLSALDLRDNPGSPLALTISLALASSKGEVRATTHTGAPFAFEVPVSVVNGRVDGCAAIAGGSTEGTVFTVTRTPGSTAPPVTVDIGALPSIPYGHAGYVLEKSPDLPLTLPNSVHTLPLVMSASNVSQQGFVRIINRSDRAGTVRIHAIDDTGRRFGPVSVSLDARAAVHFNSTDLEEGAPSKGLSGGVGDGEGNWRLELDTDLDIEPLAYIRTADGFVTSIHELAVEEGSMRDRVPIFNPGSNRSQRSWLRLLNAGASDAEVVISARDDRGGGGPGGDVRLTLPAGEARTLSARELEQGGAGFDGRLGDGAGKWRLSVTADRPVQVMSLLQSPTGHLANLSSTSLDTGDVCAALRRPPRVRGAMSPAAQDDASVAGRKSKLDSPVAPTALQIVLPPPDTAGRPSAAETSGNRPLRIGVHRDVPNEFRGDLSPRLDWVPIGDGAVVSAVSVTSPEASAMRVGMLADLVAGGEIRFFSGHADQHRRLPVITRENFYVEGGEPEILWSPVVDGDTIRVELTLPAQEALSDFSFGIEKISHIYVSMESLRPPETQGNPPRSARQHRAEDVQSPEFIDVQCRAGDFPRNLESAVARIIAEVDYGPFGATICSGTLLNDRDEGSFIPYFLTANHCVGTLAGARGAEIWWFYQTAACGGDAIDDRFEVTHGGADLLATSRFTAGAGDYTLLRLRSAPPGGVWYSGWSTAPIRPSMEVYGISHSEGEVKRYHAGTVGAGYRYAVGVDIHEGRVASGSSGSGVFSGEYLIGILTNANEDGSHSLGDSFGHIYPRVSRWLGDDPSQPDHTLPLVMSASDAGQQGFVRIINRSDRAGTVRIHAIDDTGRRFGPVSVSLDARAAVHFNSTDLEEGAPSKGLSGGVGDGEGNWRLELDTDLDIEPLAYIRTADGFVTSIHELAVEEGSMRDRVPIFNPASNRSQRSWLRLLNAGASDAGVVISARDDRGERAPGGDMRLTLPAGEARTLSARELERGGAGFDGRLGDGAGKWRLSVTADRPVQVMSLLQSPTGHLTNLSR